MMLGLCGKERMTTLHLVDPELLPLLEILPPFNLKPHTLAAVRRAGRIAAIKAAQDASDRRSRGPRLRRAGTGRRAVVHVRVYRPHDGAAVLPVLIWLHGGGFVMGSVDEDDLRAHQIVAHGLRRRVGGLSPRTRNALSGRRRGLLCRATLDVRPCHRTGFRPRPHHGGWHERGCWHGGGAGAAGA